MRRTAVAGEKEEDPAIAAHRVRRTADAREIAEIYRRLRERNYEAMEQRADEPCSVDGARWQRRNGGTAQ